MASRKTIGSPEQPIVVERDSVIIPRDEWERISAAAARAERLEAIDEDRADARIARRALERVAAGDDEFVPFALATRILDGEHPVRVWREYRGLTGAKLAKRAGATKLKARLGMVTLWWLRPVKPGEAPKSVGFTGRSTEKRFVAINVGVRYDPS